MNFDLGKACIVRRSQTDATVSFRICFADESKNWVAMDFVVLKEQFVDITKLDEVPACGVLNEKVFNLDRVKKGFMR